MLALHCFCFGLRTHFDSMMFACCSGVNVRPSIPVKTDWSFICCTSSFIPCATCSGFKPSVSCMVGFSRIFLFSIPCASSIAVVACCKLDSLDPHSTFWLVAPELVVLLWRAVACLYFLLQSRRLFLFLRRLAVVLASWPLLMCWRCRHWSCWLCCLLLHCLLVILLCCALSLVFVVLVAASFCDAGTVLSGGVATGVVRVGVASADAGVFHGSSFGACLAVGSVLRCLSRNVVCVALGPIC